MPDGTAVDIRQFDSRKETLFEGDSERPHQDTIERLTNTQNEYALIAMNAARIGALVFIVRSAQDHSILESLVRTLKGAADEQLTGERPGLIVVGVDSLSERELKEISAHDSDPANRPTLLRLAASDVLSSSKRQHLIGVSFFSRQAQAHEPSVVRTFGSVYFFPNSGSPLWNPAFDGLFSPRPSPE